MSLQKQSMNSQQQAERARSLGEASRMGGKSGSTLRRDIARALLEEALPASEVAGVRDMLHR